MSPYVVVFCEVGGVVTGAGGGVVVPEEDGHVGESGGGDKLSGSAMGDESSGDVGAAFDERVIDGHRGAETWSLGAANVNGS